MRSKIEAPSAKVGAYYINPNFIFNGDRVRFITDIKSNSAIKINN